MREIEKEFENYTYVEKTFETEKFITEEGMWVDEDGKIKSRWITTTPKTSKVDLVDILEHSRLRNLLKKH